MRVYVMNLELPNLFIPVSLIKMLAGKRDSISSNLGSFNQHPPTENHLLTKEVPLPENRPSRLPYR